MKPTIFPKILASTALCLAAVGVNSCTSCNACSWLTAQCQQKASYTYSAFSLPEVAAIRFVDKQGNIILEPSMNRPEIRKFAADLRDMARMAYSIEAAGGMITDRDEAYIALYADLIDANGTAFRRFSLKKESLDVSILYYMPPSKIAGYGVPLEIGLSESEVALLRKYSSK